MSIVRISSGWLTAEIATRGAELMGVIDSHGRDLLWNGDPAWWSGRSPLLFPIVGKVPGDRIIIEGVEYEMPQHGFARRSDFTVLEADSSSCVFELKSDQDTLRCYPFSFALRVRYQISARTLVISAVVANLSDAQMPMSFGYHPAFRWPLLGDQRRDDYEIQFEFDEPAEARRSVGGLLSAERAPTPVNSRVLHLKDDLFENGAIIFDALHSRSLIYGTREVPQLKVKFPNMPHLGIWSKPGAPFVCIEPWYGYAAPIGFCGELQEKPGIIRLQPGVSRTFEMSIELVAR